MNVASLTQYVALFCLLAFTAFSNALYAQSTETKATTEGCSKTAPCAVRTMVIKADGKKNIMVNGVKVDAKAAPNTTANPEAKSEESVVEIQTMDAKDGAAPTRLIVRQTSKDGKDVVTINGKEVDGNVDEANLPADVKEMLKGMNGKMQVKVYGLGSGTGVGDATDMDVIQLDGDAMKSLPQFRIESMVDDAEGTDGEALNSMPEIINIEGLADDAEASDAKPQVRVFKFNCKGKDGQNMVQRQVWINRTDAAGNPAQPFEFKINTDVKRYCDVAKNWFQNDLIQNMKIDTNTRGRYRVMISRSTNTLGIDTADIEIAMPVIPPMPPMPPMPQMDHMFVMDGSDMVISIPEMPAVRSFETDDLGDVPQLFAAPEADGNSDAPTTQQAPEVRKRYRVIVIERPDGDNTADLLVHNDNVSADIVTLDAESLDQPDAQVEENHTSNNTLPMGTPETNAIKAEYFNVYPNPTPGALNISFALTQPGPVTVAVSDILGNQIFSETVTNLNGQYYKQLDMSERARGTYIVSVQQNGQAISRQVIVR